MRKRFLTTLNLLGTPLLVAACAIAGSTGADRMRRTFIVLFLIASIGCSGESPVAPSPVAEIGTTPNNVAAALEPTASDATFTNVAIGLDVPVRRVTHNTTAWTFNLRSNSDPNVLAHSNKYRSSISRPLKQGIGELTGMSNFGRERPITDNRTKEGSGLKKTSEVQRRSPVFGRMHAISFGLGPTRRWVMVLSTRSETA